MAEDPTPRRVELRIRGRVQGVYFRASTQQTARSLGVTGWVRNDPDGSVRVVAEGTKAQLEALAAWCAQGPAQARVTGVEHSWEPATGEYAGFQVRR